MKREDNREERAFALLQALGDLNEEDVLRAEPGRGIRKRRNWGSIAAAAAFILVCGSVVGALYISWPMGGGQSGSTSGAPPTSTSGVTSGETGGAGSASGSDGAEGSAAEETFTERSFSRVYVYFLPEVHPVHVIRPDSSRVDREIFGFIMANSDFIGFRFRTGPQERSLQGIPFRFSENR